MCQLDVLTGVDVLLTLLSADVLVKKAFPGVPEGLAINKRQRIVHWLTAPKWVDA
jgi:hypothetical protein